jgi:hypothetical protein
MMFQNPSNYVDLARQSFARPFLCPRRFKILALALLCVASAVFPESWLSSAKAGPAVQINLPPANELSFRQLGSYSPANGLVQDMHWIGNGELLVLINGPFGAEIARVNSVSREQSEFISREFLSTVCRPAESSQLSFSLSPSQHFVFLHWIGNRGQHETALLDISAAPVIKPVELKLPLGMAVHQALFSSDDRYLTLAHDGHVEGSQASMVTFDLNDGSEYWRLDCGKLNFVLSLWADADPSSHRFYAAAEMHNGEFQAHPGLASFDLAALSRDFAPLSGNRIGGCEALWGAVSAYSGGEGAKAPYHLRFSPRGGSPDEQPAQILLNSEPLGLTPLAEPGYVLLTSRNDASSNQLWQLNLNSGKRYLIDPDCDDCQFSAEGLLAVRAAKSNSLRFYRLQLPAQPKTAASTPATATAPPN